VESLVTDGQQAHSSCDPPIVEDNMMDVIFDDDAIVAPSPCLMRMHSENGNTKGYVFPMQMTARQTMTSMVLMHRHCLPTYLFTSNRPFMTFLIDFLWLAMTCTNVLFALRGIMECHSVVLCV
jgi:hypothetical protein